jgi:NAD(P)-dependent dehydrogenase (short-subunit alcohol dehydrogenase family)
LSFSDYEQVLLRYMIPFDPTPDTLNINLLTPTQLAAGVIASTLKSFSRIDALILNHGTLDPVQRIASTSVSSWRSAFDINVFGALSFITAAIPSLRASKGRILVTSSGAALSAYSTWGAYGASKATLNHIVKTLAVEEPDITSIAIRPGVVDTKMQEAIREVHHGVMDEKDMEKFMGLHESGGLLKPEQPGHVMAKMAITERGLEPLSGGFWRYVVFLGSFYFTRFRHEREQESKRV